MINYSDKIKETMVSTLTAPNAMSAGALSLEVGVPQSTLSRWLREYSRMGGNGINMKGKRPQDWTAEEKLEAVLEMEKLDEQEKGKYLREKGIHTIHIQRWKQEMLEGLKSDGKGLLLYLLLHVKVIINTNNLFGCTLFKSAYSSHNRGYIRICCIDIDPALFPQNLCKLFRNLFPAQFIICPDIGKREGVFTGF